MKTFNILIIVILFISACNKDESDDIYIVNEPKKPNYSCYKVTYEKGVKTKKEFYSNDLFFDGTILRENPTILEIVECEKK